MSKQKVLVIDDDTWMNDIYTRSLERAGYAVSVATNAIEGMDSIDNTKPDAIVLDLFLPGPNGVVLLHELNSHDDLASIPIVVSSNNASDVPPDSLHAYGVAAVLDKSTMTPEDTVAAVRKVLA